MTTTVSQSFQQELNQVINELIGQHIVPAVTRFLSTKYNFNLNPEELTGPDCLQSPAVRTASRASFALPPKASASASNTANHFTAPAVTASPHGNCQTIVTSGTDSGKVCNRALKPGATACGIHSRGGKKEPGAPPAKPRGKANNPAANFPVTPSGGYPPQAGYPAVTNILLRPGGNGLSAIEGEPSLTNVIVKTLPDGGPLAIGWADASGAVLPLTDAHKVALTAHGISFETTVGSTSNNPGIRPTLGSNPTNPIGSQTYPAAPNTLATAAVAAPPFPVRPAMNFPGFNGFANQLPPPTIPSFPAAPPRLPTMPATALPADALTDEPDNTEFEGEERD